MEEVQDFEYANTESINSELVDTITGTPVVDGVQLPCEHMFSRSSVMQWLATHDTCPTCRTAVHVRDLKPICRLAKNLLDDLLVRPDLWCARDGGLRCLSKLSEIETVIFIIAFLNVFKLQSVLSRFSL